MTVSKTIFLSAIFALAPMVHGSDFSLWKKFRPARPDKPNNAIEAVKNRPDFPEVAAAVARAREQQKIMRAALKADKDEAREQLREKRSVVANLRSEAQSSAEDARAIAQEQMRKIAEEIKILVAESKRSH